MQLCIFCIFHVMEENMPTRFSNSLTRRAFLTGLATSALPASVLGKSQIAATVKYPRGARIPPGWKRRILVQNKRAAAMSAALAADADFMKALNEANPRRTEQPITLPSAYDWRTLKGVTSVKNQMQCGSCWAFAAIAAYESAYLIANKKCIDVSEQECIDLSEQQALDCSPPEMDCRLGGWHDQALFYLERYGMVDEDRYPYVGFRTNCTSNLERQYFLLNWGYVGDKDTPPPDEELRRAIYRRGPIVSSVYTKGWDPYRKLDDDGNPDPTWKTFPDGVFNNCEIDLPADKVDHEVLMVGWDDKLYDGVWIIKNSWGTNWGDDGYIKLPYGCNNIGLGASWVEVEATGSISASLKEKLKVLKLEGSSLKDWYAEPR
jgi:hypothetical protein